jgi:hypothetical protein
VRYPAVVLAVIATVFLSPQSASACSCAPDVTKAIKDANAIFSAEVVEVSSGRVVFDIAEVWKGKVSGRLTFLRQG